MRHTAKEWEALAGAGQYDGIGIRLSADERDLLDEGYAAEELEVELVHGKPNARYVTAQALENKGLFQWVNAVGAAGAGQRNIRVGYRLTEKGHEVARVVCSS